MTQTLMTSKEKEREKRNSAIKSAYENLKEQYPEASNWRIYRALAERFKLTPMAIRNVLK